MLWVLGAVVAALVLGRVLARSRRVPEPAPPAPVERLAPPRPASPVRVPLPRSEPGGVTTATPPHGMRSQDRISCTRR